MRLNFLIVLGALMAGCTPEKPPPEPPKVLPAATTLPAPVLLASELPVLMIYRDALNTEPSRNNLQCAVWPNGTIVWRDGRSLLQSRVEPAKIDALLQRLHAEGVFGDGNTYFANVGPESSVFDVIQIRLSDRSLKLASWHERFAQNPRVVVTSRGVESLDGRDPEEVLRFDAPEYYRFRKIWSEIRDAVRSWQPTRGEVFEGEVPIGQ